MRMMPIARIRLAPSCHVAPASLSSRVASRITRTMSAIAPSAALLARPASMRRSSSRRSSVGVRASAEKKSYFDLKGVCPTVLRVLEQGCWLRGWRDGGGLKPAVERDRGRVHESGTRSPSALHGRIGRPCCRLRVSTHAASAPRQRAGQPAAWEAALREHCCSPEGPPYLASTHRGHAAPHTLCRLTACAPLPPQTWSPRPAAGTCTACRRRSATRRCALGPLASLWWRVSHVF
jgi:hypothetical protein